MCACEGPPCHLSSQCLAYSWDAIKGWTTRGSDGSLWGENKFPVPHTHVLMEQINCSRGVQTSLLAKNSPRRVPKCVYVESTRHNVFSRPLVTVATRVGREA